MRHVRADYRARKVEGLLALRPPWPSLMRTYWNNPGTYWSKFKNGWYIVRRPRAASMPTATSGSWAATTT